MSYDDMSKEGIFEKLKDKLLHNILTTRYNYLSWFGRYNRGYEFVDFLTFYIKNFLQVNNSIVNDIYLFARNNNVNRFSDFSEHREKLVESLDKFIIKDTPPLYYNELPSLFLRPKNIYLVRDSDYYITKKDDEYKTKLEEIKKNINIHTSTPTTTILKRPPRTDDERFARAVELGIVNENTGLPTKGNEGLYEDIMSGTWGYKKK